MVSVKWPISNLLLEIWINFRDDSEAMGGYQNTPPFSFLPKFT